LYVLHLLLQALDDLDRIVGGSIVHQNDLVVTKRRSHHTVDLDHRVFHIFGRIPQWGDNRDKGIEHHKPSACNRWSTS
jgi:hypothetical protein